MFRPTHDKLSIPWTLEILIATVYKEKTVLVDRFSSPLQVLPIKFPCTWKQAERRLEKLGKIREIDARIIFTDTTTGFFNELGGDKRFTRHLRARNTDYRDEISEKPYRPFNRIYYARQSALMHTEQTRWLPTRDNAIPVSGQGTGVGV